MLACKPYTRPVSAFERMWIAAQTTCGFIMTEGVGHLSAERLRKAIAIASEANPGSRLCMKGIDPWTHWQENDVLPSVSEVEGKDWDGCGDAGAPFSDREHLDVRKAPSASYVIVHGETTRLIQRTHHATMDGLGAMQYLQDVFRAMRGEPVIGASGAETDLELAMRIGARPRIISNACLSPFTRKSTRIPGSTWARVRLSDVPKRPLARTILALSTLARRNGEGAVLIDLPTNLRPLFPEIRNTGNLTGSLRLEVPVDASLDSIEKGIKQQLADRRQGDALVSVAGLRFMPLLVMRNVAKIQARRAVMNDAFTPTGVVSNLGRVDLASYSTPDFQARSAFIIPPAFDGVPLFLVLSGSATGLDLCARAPLALGSGGRLKALLEELGKAILQ